MNGLSDLIANFFKVHGIKPNTIFLGKKQFKAVVGSTMYKTVSTAEMNIKNQKTTFMGMRIFKVDMDDFISVGLNVSFTSTEAFDEY